jgi:branched-chain amino acid transport system substrate-binding protein
MQRFQSFMDQYMPGVDKTDSILLLGYGKAQTLERVLRQCGNELTRENVMRKATSLTNVELDILLPGITVNTSPTKYSPIDQMHLMRFNGEKWELFGELQKGDHKM